MAKKENNNMWLSITDTLKWVYALLMCVLAFQFTDFKSTLDKNTNAVNDLRTQVALISQRYDVIEDKLKTKETADTIQDAKLDANYKDIQNINNRVSLIESHIFNKRKL